MIIIYYNNNKTWEVRKGQVVSVLARTCHTIVRTQMKMFLYTILTKSKTCWLLKIKQHFFITI